MTTLVNQLFSGAKSQEEQERLLKLFWNRAEVKKEVDKLRAEAQELREQLDKQQGYALRSQQKLEQLEGMLANYETAPAVVLFYALRGMWLYARRRLQALSIELQATQKDREYQHWLAGVQLSLSAAVDEVQVRIDEKQADFDRRSSEIAAMNSRVVGCSGFWQFFKRRKLSQLAEELQEQSDILEGQLNELLRCREQTAEQPLPEFPGLSIGGKRTINLTVIALAQQIYLHFEDRNISKLAREASLQQASDAHYGGRRDCRELRLFMQELVQKLEADTRLPEKVKARSVYLGKQVRYRQELDTVPDAATLSAFPIMLDGVGATKDLNVVAEGFWDVNAVLLN
ncbi:MAG: hypothetical protein ACR2P6_03005 [Gammaproteobacteria bacterium]